MGLESHIVDTLAREKSGMVEGEDFEFNNGLIVYMLGDAKAIQDILDDSGDFGPTHIIEHGFHYKIAFGHHKIFFNGRAGYEKYANEFKNGNLNVN